MSKLVKERIYIGEETVSAFSQAFCESDIIVPDTKPDILKILQTKANVNISSAVCGREKINITGKCDITIIYEGENHSICSIKTSRDFYQSIDSCDISEEMKPFAECSVASTDFTLINSRRLNGKILISLDVVTYVPCEREIPTDLSDDCFEIQRMNITPCRTVFADQRRINIKDKLQIPEKKPCISEILSMDCSVKEKDIKIISNKMIIKGTVIFSTLYIEDTPLKSIQSTQHEIPFTEVLDAPGAEENMIANIKIMPEKCFFEAEHDNDGDFRYITADCMLLIFAKITDKSSFEVISDIYSVNEPIEADISTAVTEQLVCKKDFKILLSDMATLPNSDIMQIYQVNAQPVISGAVCENGKITITGLAGCDIIYSNQNDNQSFLTYRHVFKFEESINAEEIKEGMICDIFADFNNLNYTISGSNSVDIRITMSVCALVTSKKEFSYVNGYKTKENCTEEKSNDYGIKIYFAKKGESLWDIAKRYEITTKSLIETNNLSDEETLSENTKIILCR